MTGSASGTENDSVKWRQRVSDHKKPVMIHKINELLQEFRTVFSGRTNTADTIIPPLLYALVNLLAGLLPAMLSALALAAILTVLRLVRKQSWLYALSGLVLTLLAAGLAWFTQNTASFFLPDLLTSGMLLAAALLSIWAGKPLAAWSSHLTRVWPKEWYWLPNRIFIPPTRSLERPKERFLVTGGESIRAYSSYRLHNPPGHPIFDLPSFQAEERR